MAEETLKTVDYFSPITWIVGVLSFPLRFFAFVVSKIRVYDPEKAMCPACGFKGDSGTGGKSCSVMCVKTNDAARYALQHICFRCACAFYAPVLTKVEKWAAREIKK